jgi:2-polyprenyl-3-methyl-5-hydroxy-6-metoxy-1,4-benzoquinol methylase
VTPSPCRLCGSPLTNTFADLGLSPLANSYVAPERLSQKESFYPLHAYVCRQCFLVQLDQFERPDQIFTDYLYFSSFSDSWLTHCRDYAGRMVARLDLGARSQVVEVASNDGYLLQYFVARGIPVLGIEPAANVAQAAMAKGIPTEVAFFGSETAQRLHDRGVAADLIVANNVLAHVPALTDFVEGLRILLMPNGTITIECPHLLRLVSQNQFDTIYHEHFSYFSLLVLEKVFANQRLRIVDVEELPTHGGSLRVYVRHAASADRPSPAVLDVLARERDAGLDHLESYERFGAQVVQTKCDVLSFFVGAHAAGKTVVGYGAPAKGNTLLNYCGIGPELMPFTVDRSPHKQGLYLPGTRIPIRAPEDLVEARPDYVFILPWNLRSEISDQMSVVRSWGGQFVVPIPQLEIF